MNLLFLVQHFRQGWGGVPESARLMARRLAAKGAVSDVFDVGTWYSGVGTMETLPLPATPGAPSAPRPIGEYDAIVHVGPWQSPLPLLKLLAGRPAHQPLFYLPSGGLARIEFAPNKAVKKIPYLHLVERHFLNQADAIVYTSVAEQEATVRAARRPGRERIIPYLIDPAPAPAEQPIRAPGEPVTFSFMAEIGPRKGLLPLVQAFARWVERGGLGDKVRLRIGGGPRVGEERYLAEVRAVLAGFAGRVDMELIGPIAHGDRAEFYGETDIFLVPSLFESFGLTVLEAMQQGCAVIAGPHLGTLEFIPPADFLTVAAGTDPASLEAALGRSYAVFTARGRPFRDAITDHAGASVAAINERAFRDWTELLAPGKRSSCNQDGC